MSAPSNEELERRLLALERETYGLRAEVERLKGRGSGSVPVPAPDVPPAARLPVGPAAKVVFTPQISAKSAPIRRSWAFNEKFVGETLTQYAGMVVLALGVIFFLIWTAAYAGPAVRVAIAAGAGAALVALGARAATRPPYDRLAGTLIGGGWTVLYVTVYAAYHFEATKIIGSATVEMGLLLAAAAGLTAHAVSRRSRPLRLYAVGLTYALMFLCGRDVADFDFFMILFAASVAVAAETGEADVLAASLCGYYLNYVPVYLNTVATTPSVGAATRAASGLALPLGWLAGPFLLVAALPLLPKARRNLFPSTEKFSWGEAALCLNAGLFALTASALVRGYFGGWQLARAAPLALLLAVASLMHARLLSRRSPAAGLEGALALALLAAAMMGLPDPMWRLMGWITLSCTWVWVGLLMEQAVWRAAGLGAALMTFALFFFAAAQGAAERRAAGLAMVLFAVVAYLFSRVYRLWLESPEEWEKPATSLWVHVGSLALLLGLWSLLDAGPLLCVLAALAIVSEQAAARFDRADLWLQASMLESGMCAYSFFVDYGSGVSVAGLAPRLWTTGVVAASSYYLYFDGPVSEALAGRWTRWTRAQSRRALSWLAAGAVSFAVYQEFDARLRLPVWAAGCLGLLWLGRARGNEDFRRQGAVLAGAAAVEAVATYLLAPKPLLSPLGAWSAALYWAACAALLAGLGLLKSRRWGEPTAMDERSGRALGALAVVLGACFLAKELDQTGLTLAWTGLGLAALTAGLALDWAELRYPALVLLTLCVVKALVLDTAGLALPYRVASFVSLGVVLLLASSLYARAGARAAVPASDEKKPAVDPG